MLSGCESALKPGNRRRLSTHAFGNLGLCEAGFVPRLQEKIKERTFFSLDTLDFLSDTRPAHELGHELVMSSHS
jgi:hypothetical protein